MTALFILFQRSLTRSTVAVCRILA